MYQETLVDILKDQKNLADVGVSFIEGSDLEDFLSYQELYQSALRVLAFLQASGIKPKHELVFQIDDNKTFIIVFWACILGGIIPVPVAIGRNDDHKQKLFNIWPFLNKPWLIVSGKHLDMLEAFSKKEEISEAFANFQDRRIDLDKIFSVDAIGEVFPSKANDIAFIQFSSGSTGSPKGVTLTHKNLITNMNAIAIGGSYTPKDSLISWMPLTHDMGLIGFHLNPLICGIQHYIIPTSLFVRRPSIWLDKASEHKISVLCSPNFGYHYVIKHCLHSTEINWDLTHVRLIYNGAEPISEELCQEFLEKLLPYGLQNLSMCPVYGLAEASLAVSMSDLDKPVRSIRLDRDKLSFGEKVSEPKDLSNTVSFVNVGREISHCSIRITDRDYRVLADNTIGHVEIKGDNVTSGYYNNQEASQAAITEGAWLNTGDLGFMREGELFITGRDKDIIFVNGQNYYPHDIERLGEELPGIELNKIAVAGYFNHDLGQDELLGFVFHRGDLEKFVPIASALVKHINEQIGLNMDRVIPVKVIPKTTSGKIQRFKLLQDFKKGAFAEVEQALDLLIHSKSSSGNPIVLPSTPLEQKMLDIWEKVLQRSPISLEDRFFEIGGNSLKAAELGMALQKEFQVELTLDILYENQTLGKLTGILPSLDTLSYEAIPQVPEKEWYDVSVAQKGIFYQWELNKSSLSYNMPAAFQVTGPLNIEKIDAALGQLLDRHENLRMNFRLQEKPQFTIHEKIETQVEVLASSFSNIDDLLKSLVQPFDLRKGPLFRFKLIKLKHERHVLFVDIHHIVSDGVSIQKLLHELWALYSGEKLAEIPTTFKDYISWEERQLESSEIKSQREYWISQLGEELPILRMPTDFVRPALFEDKGGKLNSPIGKSQVRQLKKLAERYDCTMHVLMFTLYNILLHKYSGQDEFIIGIPVSGRTHADLQDMQGMFVNNLPLRTQIPAEESFTAVLADLTKKIKKALDNQQYPFGKLVENLNISRDVSRNPVFDTMFVYQNMGLFNQTESELESIRYFFDPGFSKYDISMEVFEEEGSLEYSIEYASSLFTKETIARLSAHFQTLIAQVIQNPENQIAELSLLSEEAYEKDVKSFNDTQAPVALEMVHQLFEKQVAKTPDKIALDFHGESYTYEVLEEKANRQATILKKNGIQAGSTVAILLDRSLELIVSILAVLKSGACFVPIDPELPKNRIKFIVDDSHADLVITQKKHLSLVSRSTWEQNEVDYSLVYVKKENNPSSNISSQAFKKEKSTLAYLIYTSGTTGNPKGVMISHDSFANYISWAANTYAKESSADFPLFSSLSFDLTITSIFTPLVTGNRMVIYGHQEQELLLEQVISENKVDVIKLTPSHLKLLCQQKTTTAHVESRVKRLIVGGEQLTSQLAKETYNLFGKKVEIINEYGPTEATVGCMNHTFEEVDISAAVPIGVPIQNTQLYVLDPYLHPVPTGIEGELYIAGKGLAEGYRNREELTQQKFIDNPFIKGQKMYKTGDIVRRLASGKLVYIGRRDNQVKINGYRIELTEIEQCILNHDNINDAVVLTTQNKSGQTYLKAYYQPNTINDAQLEEVGLKDFLASMLPHYMIPASLIQVGKIPLTQNGKVDYQELSKWEQEQTGKEERMPISSVEEFLVHIWREVLDEEIVSVWDNFYELGGDSIKAVQIASKLQEKGYSIQVKDILTHHTIAQISKQATTIQDTHLYDQDTIEGNIQPWPIISWFFGQAFEIPGFYNQSVLLNLNQVIDVDILQRAINKLLIHHDGLRINYDRKQQELFFNDAHVSTSFSLRRIDNGNDKDLPELLQEIKGGTDLENDLLLKGAIITEDGRPHQLFLTAHHLIVDGISWRILLQDLQTAYEALSKGEEVVFPSKTASLANWSAAVWASANRGIIEREEAYWEEIEKAEFSIPLDFETEDWQASNLVRMSKVLGKEQTNFLLKEAPASYKTNIHHIQLTALAQVLHTWTNQSMCVIELESHGRHLEGIDVSRTVGWFTAMHPVKITLETEDLGEQIKCVKRLIQEIPNDGIGYGMKKIMRDQVSPYEPEISEIRFNYLGQFGQELDNDLFTFDRGNGLESSPLNSINTKLEFNTMVIDGQLLLELNYNAKAFQKSTILWVLDQFVQKMDDLISHIVNKDTLYFTPADFENVELNQTELDALFN